MKGEQLQMTSNSIRSFACGLLAAAVVCAAAYFLDKDAEPSINIDQDSITEMKQKLSEEGFVVSTAEEWNAHITEHDNANEPGQKESKAIYRTIVPVSSGMTSIDVGYILKQGKIIESATQFSIEVERRGVENRLRPGIYEVDSEMTIDEIISTIF